MKRTVWRVTITDFIDTSFIDMEVNLKVPKDLSEITLKQYQEFLKIQSKNDDEEFIAQKMISIFCGITMLEVLKIRLTSLNDLIEHFTTIFSAKSELIERFTLNGIEYGHIPKLEDMSFGEYIDLETNIQDFDNYHIAMSAFYRPIKNKVKHMHSIEDYEPSEEKQRTMLDMPLDVAIGATVFFYNLETELLKCSLSYSRQQMKKMRIKTSQVEDSSQSNGDGILQSMQSQMATLQNSIQSRDLTFFNVSPISHLKSKRTK